MMDLNEFVKFDLDQQILAKLGQKKSEGDEPIIDLPHDEENEIVDLTDEIEPLEDQLLKSGNLHESIRDLVFAKTAGEDNEDDDGERYQDNLKKKRRELYELLENIDQELADKSIQEVAAVFSSMVTIQCQLCTQKTDGIITVKVRLSNFFSIRHLDEESQQTFRKVITLIFTPEEISKIRKKLADFADSEPLKPLFHAIVDQAYDVVRFNEMVGRLLVEMTRFFIDKLQREGYKQSPQVLEFEERHQRSILSLEKAVDELSDAEATIQRHMKERPVLEELPKVLRDLIHIKLGFKPAEDIPALIEHAKALLPEYNRARNAVSFDFNRLPSFQHGLRLRQSIILNLHKDIIKFTGEKFQEELEQCQKVLDSVNEQIEALSQDLEPGSPEYDELLQKKTRIQESMAAYRKKLDVVNGQKHLVEMQHQMVTETIQEFQKNNPKPKKMDEELNKVRNRQKFTKSPTTPKKKKPSRMVRAHTP